MTGTVLIAGASGLVGTAAAIAFRDAGWEVVAGIGLIVAIAGAVALSRLGEIPEPAGPPLASEPA